MSNRAIERKPVPSSVSDVPLPPHKSQKRVYFESKRGPSAVPPTIPPIAITSLLRSPSPATLQRPPTPTEYFDIPCPPDTFDPDGDVLALNIPSTPVSPNPEPNITLPTAATETNAEIRARNNHIFAAAANLSNGLTQLEICLGGVDLIPGLRQQASISRLECQAFYNFLSPIDKELFLAEQIPIFAARVHALVSRTEECNLRVPCVQVLNTSICIDCGKDGKETVRWEVGEKDGPPSWRDMALGAGILGWVRRRMRVYAGPGRQKAMEDGVGGKVRSEQVALWEDLPGCLKGLVERPEGSECEDEDELGEGSGTQDVDVVEGVEVGELGRSEDSEGRGAGGTGRMDGIGKGKGVARESTWRSRKPGFLTLWHEMLRRDDVVLRKKEELVKMMREGRERMERGECRWCGDRDAGPGPGGRPGGWLRRLRGR